MSHSTDRDHNRVLPGFYETFSGEDLPLAADVRHLNIFTDVILKFPLPHPEIQHPTSQVRHTVRPCTVK